MNREQYLEAKKILANAPHQATHSDSDGGYYRFAGKYWHDIDFNGDVIPGRPDFDYCDLHSLSDIKTMVEQYETIEKLKSALTDEMNEYNCCDAEILEQDYCDRPKACSTCKNKRYLVDLLKELTE